MPNLALNLASDVITDADAEAAAYSQAIDHITDAPIRRDPFPHLYIRDIFPSAYYSSLLQRIESAGKFVPTVYPGVGVDLKASNFKDHGLTCGNLDTDPRLSTFHAFLKSERFTRALLDKFSAPESGVGGPAIPVQKHNYFVDAQDISTVFDLHKDLAGYEISPHPDVPSKIVTFLLYLTPDDSLREFGTLFCTPKAGASSMKKQAKNFGSKVSRALFNKTVEMTGPYGLTQREGWLPWEDFDVAAVAEAWPNSFLAFAPNERSYHAVRMNIPPDRPVQERLTLRGFIRSSQDARNWRAEHKNTFRRRTAFRIARILGRS